MNPIKSTKPIDIPQVLSKRELAEDIYRINKFNKKMNAFTIDEKPEVDQNGKKYVNLTLKQKR